MNVESVASASILRCVHLQPEFGPRVARVGHIASCQARHPFDPTRVLAHPGSLHACRLSSRNAHTGRALLVCVGRLQAPFAALRVVAAVHEVRAMSGRASDSAPPSLRRLHKTRYAQVGYSSSQLPLPCSHSIRFAFFRFRTHSNFKDVTIKFFTFLSTKFANLRFFSFQFIKFDRIRLLNCQFSS